MNDEKLVFISIPLDRLKIWEDMADRILKANAEYDPKLETYLRNVIWNSRKLAIALRNDIMVAKLSDQKTDGL